MASPIHRTAPNENLHFHELIPLGESPLSSPRQSQEAKIFTPDYCEPEDIRDTIDKWQQHIYEDFMQKKAAEAKAKMFNRIKKTG